MPRFLRWPSFRRRRERRASASSGGCLAAFFTCLVSLLFLLLNVSLVQAAYTVLISFWPAWTRDSRVAQAFLLLGPISMLVVEWWFVELLADQLANRSRGAAERK